MIKSAAKDVATLSKLASAERRNELDILTTLIVFGLAFFHTASIFNRFQLVVNEMQSELTTIVASFFVYAEFLWIMPVMMFVAGIAIYYSLQRRSAGQFVRERLLRLGIPFLTGLALANPPQIYYYLKRMEGLQDSFLSFYPRYWNIKFSLLSFPYFLEPAGGEDTFNVLHLWFIIFLLVYTLLLVPLLIYLKGQSGRQIAERMAGFFSRRFAVFLWAIPIALLEALAGAIWPSGWCRWIWPFIIFFGFLSASDERLTEALARHRVAGLVIGAIGFLVLFAGMGALMMSGVDPWMGREPAAMLFRLVKGTVSWFLVVGIVGLTTHLGQRARAAQHEPAQKPGFWERLAAYGREAQLPYYVLHQTPIIMIGYAVVQWNIGVLPKFLIISLSSLVLVMLVYELLIRRIPALRFLFGMKARRS